MDWLLGIREALEKQVFERAVDLLGLEIDLLLFDTTQDVLHDGGGRSPGARDQYGNHAAHHCRHHETRLKCRHEHKAVTSPKPQTPMSLALRHDGPEPNREGAEESGIVLGRGHENAITGREEHLESGEWQIDQMA
jgi:hypothetical protein